MITSFEPNHNAISREPANSDERYKFDTYTKHVLENGQTTKAYEDEAKRRFIEEPANLKLLIVVSKLLTGFDAPCLHTMYADKPMQGHGLMQAIARVNRVFRDKPGGLVVDYLGLADQLKKALITYTESGVGDGGCRIN